MSVAGADLSWPLRRAVQLYANSPAVTHADRTVTYGELAERVGGLGAAIADLGVPLGGRIGFLGANSLAHLECWLAIPAFGRVLVDLNFRLARAELAFMVDDCALELLVVDADQLDVGRALLDACPSLRQLVFDGAGETPADCLSYEQLISARWDEPPGVDGDSLATISYTGGTTGTPKGVMLSHANLLANARHNLISTGHRRADRWLHVSPMFHVAGTANIFACTWVGARQVVLSRFAAAPVLRALADHQITHAILVPTMLAMFLDEFDRHPVDLPALRHIQYAASPITPELQRRVGEALDCELVQMYGMTEAAPSVSSLSGEDHVRGFAGEEPFKQRLRSSGVPMVGVEAGIRDPDGQPLAPGEIGEIWVRGPNVMLGYWNRPDATELALSDGWYRTGDAGYVDGDGYIFLVDRLKDMIISGGENVYSIEVEAALAEHPEVVEAAVFGVPHPRWGEAVHAVVSVVPASTVTPEMLIEHCRERIAGYKLPRSIDIQSEPLPKSGAGKPVKNVLREPFWAGRERQVN